MQTASNQFEHELKTRIDEEIELRMEAMSYGTMDFPTYQRTSGEISGLRKVAGEICDDITKKMNER